MFCVLVHLPGQKKISCHFHFILILEGDRLHGNLIAFIEISGIVWNFDIPREDRNGKQHAEKSSRDAKVFHCVHVVSPLQWMR
ncbi:hypothetical protein [Desulfovibrio sp.]|uniref:hypothetical protein n=1 Tax=Desulfovibrio sp. TaxID=885 RepID=UPI0025C4FAD0|nr:hypothetical protein [Desulfovibrio sp.]